MVKKKAFIPRWFAAFLVLIALATGVGYGLSICTHLIQDKTEQIYKMGFTGNVIGTCGMVVFFVANFIYDRDFDSQSLFSNRKK